MNPLEKYLNLFSNGHFRVSIEYYTKIKNDIWDLVGCYCGELMLEKGKGDEFDHTQIHPSDAKLVARPKEDMTDEEIRKYDQIKQKAFWEIGSGVTINEPGFYLLKIGVYPFDNSHFGDTVIDTRTLTNA